MHCPPGIHFNEEWEWKKKINSTQFATVIHMRSNVSDRPGIMIEWAQKLCRLRYGTYIWISLFFLFYFTDGWRRACSICFSGVFSMVFSFLAIVLMEIYYANETDLVHNFIFISSFTVANGYKKLCMHSSFFLPCVRLNRQMF